MMKDRGQKRLAARFCAMQGLVPFVEVIVRSSTSIESSPINITDIDVFGVEVAHFGRTRRTVFDCKTANKQSGINRALWASGLRHFVEAESAFVIQAKMAPDTHKLAASSMKVNIHTEDSFRRYANSLNTEFQKEATYLDEMDQWDALLGAASSNAAMADLIFFVTTQAALELSGSKGVRLGISHLLHASGELDPRKMVHKAVFGSVVSAFLLHMAMAVGTLKDIFDFSVSREVFEQRLRYFLWEGRDNYELRQKLRRALSERLGEANGGNFDLPEWGRLVELVRGYLDAPEALASLPLIVKEIAFRNMTVATKADADRRLTRLLSSTGRARQFIFSAVAYLVQAAGLPREFQKDIETTINALLE